MNTRAPLPPDGPVAAPGRAPAKARRTAILDMIDRNGFATVSGIAQTFAVTDMTVRRDLQILNDEGRLTRTHGGGVSLGRREIFDLAEPEFQVRRRRNAEGKAAIAQAAARLIGARESIGLDVGASALALAERLADRRDITVFTNNLHAAVVLGQKGAAVHVLGGLVRGPELSVVGAAAVEQIRQYYLTRYFLGVSGLTEAGFFDYSPEDAEIKRAFIEQAEAVVVLCDSSKFDRRSVSKVCDLRRAAMLVTDAEPPAHLAEALSRAGVEVVVAEPIAR